MVQKMEALRPSPPAVRKKLETAIKLIDEINCNDPAKVTLADGVPRPYRVVYSDWVLSWVKKLDDKASDELIILAKGRNVESWKLAEIKRDDYSPNSGGMKLWEQDRKVWLANRLESVMKEAGYEGEPVRAVREVMLKRNVPDPKDIRKFDLVGALGAINYKLLEEAKMIQTLRDADALVFMEKNFPQMADRMSSEEVMLMLKKELGGISRQCTSILLGMPHWSAVQLKMITKALPPPSKRLRSIMLEAEGTAASSTHPGDWRYKDFSYD
jgi:hypothetical protein